MKTEMDTSLWIKGTTLFSCTTSSAVVILSSEFLSQGERSHRKTQALELLPCGSSWTTPPLELIHTSSFRFSTYQFHSICNLAWMPVLNPDTLQLETNGLSLESSFGTKTNIQITRDIVISTLKEPAVVFSRKGISTENGVHATTMCQKTQGQPNTPPRVIHAIKWIAATVGHEFSFSIPPETFHDQEDGNSTQLTLGMNLIDGSPTDLDSWLQFNARDKRMYGYLLDADFQYSPQFLLFAIDSGGLKTEDKFVVEIFKPTIIPCHVYTVIAKDSYHLFLKNRKSIYLFLKKLSNYLLAESPGHVVLLHLKTGSAVFTWYNKSFCPKAEKCARDDIQDVLIKLGRPEEDIHPDFAEAMLPEFKIEQIGEVGYGGMCLSTTKPTNDSVAFNRTVNGFDGGNCWITNALMALLVAVCCTILAFLIIVYCQKYRKKTFQSECSPSCGHIDFKMGTLTSRKSPILEQDVLPSTRLPIPMSMVCQQRSFRQHRGLVISKLPSPPKYRLPPLYERRDPG
uniref:Peptidase S72 domain-containing protein n=1 Tax=Laticauda laticaudata TaxID=8630 RepID=A0A8C5WMX9_LATLA